MNRLKVWAVISSLLFVFGCNPPPPGEKSLSTPAPTPQQSDAINWVDSTSYWHPATDDLGSSIDTAGGLFQGESARVGFTITPKKSEVWPYVELIFRSPIPLTNTTGLVVNYRCDKPLIVKLSQRDFNAAPEGNSTWSYYQKTLPPSAEWSQVELSYEEFAQPDWATEESRTIPLRLENVTGVYFTPQLDAIRGESALTELKLLKFVI